MAGAFHGIGEPEAVINVGVSGPGVVNHAMQDAPRDMPLHELADLIKKLSFKLSRAGELVGREAARRLGLPFGIIDLSLAPTPVPGDSVADIIEDGLERLAQRARQPRSLSADPQERRRDGETSVGGMSRVIPVGRCEHD